MTLKMHLILIFFLYLLLTAIPEPHAQSASPRDPYQVLNIDRKATLEEIKQAYRGFFQYHPDSHPGDPLAARKFGEASEAYKILKDPETRTVYDRKGFRGLAEYEDALRQKRSIQVRDLRLEKHTPIYIEFQQAHLNSDELAHDLDSYLQRTREPLEFRQLILHRYRNPGGGQEISGVALRNLDHWLSLNPEWIDFVDIRNAVNTEEFETLFFAQTLKISKSPEQFLKLVSSYPRQIRPAALYTAIQEGIPHLQSLNPTPEHWKTLQKHAGRRLGEKQAANLINYHLDRRAYSKIRALVGLCQRHRRSGQHL